MIEPILFLHILFATIAILGGLGSRTFLTSLVTGLFTGLIHGGLIALVGAQAGKFEITELPYLNLATDYVMEYAGAYLTFPNARYVTYLVVCGIALMLATFIAWLVRFILCSIVCAMLPKRDKAATPVAPAKPVEPVAPVVTAAPVAPVATVAPVVTPIATETPAPVITPEPPIVSSMSDTPFTPDTPAKPET